MDDSILADPMRMNDELFGYTPTRITLPPNTWVKLVGTNPRRQAIVVQALTSIGDLYVMPSNLGTVGGVAVVGPTGLVVVHSSVYLGVTFGIWYGFSANGQDVLVWDQSRS